ncbi:hypothetical protein WJX81_003485 [Elliptochloris bilobata]|uniref:Peptidyl-prolyl cis-trans isomerase n=1 Tax=Elliptochloris bilobata TaxID=381761 RepID=A0AAW1SCE0_9CHLO
MVLAYLDINIGDPQDHSKSAAEYALSQSFYTRTGAQVGLPGSGSLSDLTAESKGLLKEAFNADPQWSTKALCTGERGLDKASRKPLHFKGNCFHRVVKGFICQAGDINRGDGSGGASIYGGKFNDEKAALKLKHDRAGIVGFANSGKNSNSSQFYITFAAAPQCDGKHVIIGCVAEGLDVLNRIEAEAASADGTPRVEVRIADCGILPS